MWTRSAANKITGMIKVTVIDANNVLFFEGEFPTLHEAQAASGRFSLPRNVTL